VIFAMRSSPFSIVSFDPLHFDRPDLAYSIPYDGSDIKPFFLKKIASTGGASAFCRCLKFPSWGGVRSCLGIGKKELG